MHQKILWHCCETTAAQSLSKSLLNSNTSKGYHSFDQMANKKTLVHAETKVESKGGLPKAQCIAGVLPIPAAPQANKMCLATIGTPSGHHRDTIGTRSGHHRDTSGTRSGQNSSKVHEMYGLLRKGVKMCWKHWNDRFRVDFVCFWRILCVVVRFS